MLEFSITHLSHFAAGQEGRRLGADFGFQEDYVRYELLLDGTETPPPDSP